MASSTQTCPTCKGSKFTKNPDGSLWQKCPNCDGTGWVRRPGLFYAYRTNPQALGALGTVTFSFTIVNWDFQWLQFTGDFTGAFTFQLQDTGNRNFFQNAGPNLAPIHSS